jgi:low molecular weight protein-tyrosine phosphatase
MAAALLSAQLTARRAGVAVCSAGIAGTGQPPLPEVIEVMAARGLDVARQRSRAVTPADLAGADLILGMSREHVRHATVLLPRAWPRAFTLRELARRGQQAGARDADEPIGGWLARAASCRNRRDLLGASPADDIADPTGGPRHGYDATASVLDELTHELADLCWPYARGAAR